MSASADPFGGIVLSSNSTIRDAMQAITANAREMILIHDESRRIIGLIADGDIRRGLLRGLNLESPASEVMTRDFVWVSADPGRAAVLDLMRARTIRHIPVLDAERRLVAIHFLRDLIGAMPKPNVAVIMAGGKGTRLRPFTENLPKPMVPVAGRPILERIVLHLIGHGIRHFFIAVNFMADAIERHFADGSEFGCRIEYLREAEPLGTGGALSLLPAGIDNPLLVLNGDQITNVDVSALLESHRTSGCRATMCVGPYQVQVPFGTVAERDGRLVGLEEKPDIRLLINRGVYVLDSSALKHVPKDRAFPVTGVFEELLAQEQPVNVFYSEESWLDVGRPEDLRRANGV